MEGIVSFFFSFAKLKVLRPALARIFRLALDVNVISSFVLDIYCPKSFFPVYPTCNSKAYDRLLVSGLQFNSMG